MSLFFSVLLTAPSIRTENMPYCPTISKGERGQYSCQNSTATKSDQDGDNSICCWNNSTQPWRNDITEQVSISGKFNCDPTGESTEGHGQVVMDNQYGLGWTVDGHLGRGGVVSNSNEPMCIESTGSYSTQRNTDSSDACPWEPSNITYNEKWTSVSTKPRSKTKQETKQQTTDLGIPM